MALAEQLDLGSNGNDSSGVGIVPPSLDLLRGAIGETFVAPPTRAKRLAIALAVFRRHEGHLFDDPDGVYERRVDEHVPPEFRAIATRGLHARIIDGRKAVQDSLPY